MHAYRFSIALLQLLPFMVLLCWSWPAQAIVNLEQAIIGPSNDGMHSRLDFLVSGNSGNTENNRTKVDLLTLWQHEPHTEFLQMQYNHGTSLGQVDTDNAFAHYRHRYELSPDFGLEGFGQISRDPFARLTQRTLWGGGVRWVLFEESKKSASYLGLGAFHEQEQRTDVAGTTDVTEVETWRANVYLVLKYQFNSQVSLVNNTYYQPALDDGSNFRLLEQASMMVKLDDHLDLKLSLEMSYDSIPPQTVQPRDTYYSSGLSFSF
jgi:putative salt-induced outer membrane protein YdiY